MFAFFQKWHRKIGIIVALFVIFLVISGIALNHSHTLKLNIHYIKNDWLLDLYQINPTKKPIGFNEANNWVTQIENRIYFNDIEVANDIDQLFGLILINDNFVIAMDGQLTLVSKQGEIIEHMTGADGVPAGMREIGISDEKNIIIKAAHGFYQVNLDELEWEEFDHLDAVWSKTKPLPNELEQSLLKKYRGTGLSMERVLLDLHSGRILGPWGVYLVDIAAILFLLLAISGSWMWWTNR
ncbi:MAG: PepSY domain-containing protein [Proteobacteria bacterium]|nr:PepSY domain-containing protein [Pseudomonadota bacterium]